MNIKISFFAKCDSFLFPTCFYEVNKNSINTEDYVMLNEFRKEKTDISTYVFVINSLNQKVDINNMKGIYDGVLARLTLINDNLYLYVLGKTKLSINDIYCEVSTSKIIIEGFIREKTIFLNMAKEANIIANYKTWIKKEDNIAIEKNIDVDSNASIVIHVLNFINNMVSLENTKVRQKLYDYYDYTFYLDIVNLFLDHIKGKTINTKDITADSILDFFDKIEKKKSMDKQSNLNETSIVSHRHVLSKEFFKDVKPYNITVALEKQNIVPIPKNIDSEYVLNVVEKEFMKHLMLPVRNKDENPKSKEFNEICEEIVDSYLSK